MQNYVATRPLTFGDQTFLAGEAVPIIEGRDYARLLKLGLIALAPGAGAADPKALDLRFQPGDTLIFVGEDGAAIPVTFKEAEEAADEVRTSLGLTKGALVALVGFPGESAPTYVSLASLLPEQPTTRLIDALRARVQEAASTPTEAQALEVTALEGRVSFLELLIQAIRAEGDPIPDDFPAAEFLALNGVVTVPGLQLLAAGKEGAANLQRLSQIGEGRSKQILAALPKLQPGADPPPGDSPPPPPSGA